MSDFPLDPSASNLFPNGGTVTPQIIATRNPLASDQYPIGYFWFNKSAISLWAQQGFVSGVPQWELISSAAGDVTSVSGTANQILPATASGGSVTLSIAPTFTSPGSVTATLGNITATNGNLAFGTAGNKITAPAATTIAAGANSFGTVVLVGGTATVSTTAVTAASIILLTNQTLGTVTSPQAIGVTARTPTTSFVITSAGATDTSTIGWEIIN